ncbi:MAG: hypothetical protein AAGE01_10360 [Pseudomonadota bacterium]
MAKKLKIGDREIRVEGKKCKPGSKVTTDDETARYLVGAGVATYDEPKTKAK